ncbi:MAG: translocation/assembly module TamB domain-containing protein, partial [Gemmatimonadota bacterium]
APGVLPPGALITGRVEIDGVPGRAPLALDIDVRLNGGRVVAQGTLDLAGPVAAYDLAGRVVDLPVGALVPVEVPPVTLTAAFSLAGQGTEPETIDARVALDGGFGAWRTEPGDGIRLDADVEDGRLALDTLSLELATLRLDAAGAWRYATPTAGGIDYDLDVTSLEPFGPYLPPPVRGAVWGSATTRGELTGTLDVPRFAGEADAEDLRYADWFIGAAAADYAVTAPPRRGLELDLAAETVETPQLGAFDRVLLRARARDPSFDVTLNATRPGRDDGVLLVADGRFLDGTRVATLRDLRFDLDGSPWTLVEPATVRWGDEVDGLDVSDLRLREADGDGVLAFDGRYPPDGADGLRFQAEAVPIAEWFRLADRAPPLTAMVWADGELFGTLASPRVDLDFRLLRPRIDDVQFARLEGVLAYGAGRLAGDVDVRVDTVPATGGTLDIDGGVPFNLSLTDGFDARLAETGAIEITAVADRFPFVVLEPLLFDLRDPEGWIDGRVVAGGTIRRPRLDGRLILRDGAATVLPLDQRYDSIHAVVGFEDRRAVVREARARSDGWARVAGTVDLETLDRPVLDLRLDFEEFRPIGVDDRDDAAVWGELRTAGPWSAPVLSGEIRIDDGTVPVPGLDDDALDAGLDEEAFAELETPVDTVVRDEPTWIDRIVLDAVVVTAGEDTWFGDDPIRAQLAGELTLVRTAPDALQVFGSLEGERGTITLIAGPIVRRLDIVEAEVRFFGAAALDPAIDITASQTVFGPDGQPFDILVRIGGSLDDPTLALASPDGAPVPESELLSLLVFGQPTYALAPGVVPAEEVVGDVFFGGLAGLAAIEIEEALVGEFGLPFEYVRIQPGPGDFGGLFGAPIIVLGTQLADDVFLTIDTGLGTLFGGTEVGTTWGAAIQWRIDPEWTAEFGIEPVFRGRFFPTAGFFVPALSPEQQFFLDLRRRWTY